MTTQLLATELANLIQESKRKHNDLRQAAEKSLEDLKSLGNVTEQTAPEQLSQKTNFVNPFIIACGTKNAKFTAIAIVCLQRLIVAKALPRSRLSQVLEALMQATSAGLDVQLKILQALPSLLQNYSAELKADLLVTALNICFTLQSSKNAIVNNTSAATLQQLIVSVFDKLVSEDKNEPDAPKAGEAPTSDGKVELRSAALDAYRIFNDLCLLTENQRPEFLRFSGLSQTFGLELIESVITNHADVFTTHPEQSHVLRIRVMPLIISALKAKPAFAISVRLVRILYTLMRRHISMIPRECGEALDIMSHLLDQDTPLWKRALCMEVFRGIFAEHALVRRIYALYDAKDGEKDVLKTLAAAFVRLSTEKPNVIGLGHQSTMPISNASDVTGGSGEQAMLDSSGVAGIISTPSAAEGANIGISTQWSTVRVPCIDQLDKTDPPTIPESYVYSLILTCLSSLSDGLAKFILPLTVSGEARSRRRTSKSGSERDAADSSLRQDEGSDSSRPAVDRSASFRKNPVSVNPLTLEDHAMHSEVKICAAIVDECWPAILATCSTFLYASLDSEYYHGLVRAFQRFAHVAGLLQLSTPRDAFLTTLGKAAVPPNVLTACLTTTQNRQASSGATPETPSSLLDNAKGFLTPDSRTQTSTSMDKQRQAAFDAALATLNTRNLLCLRALLNLGIALGSTLGGAWRIVLETLQQADFVLYSSGKAAGRTTTLSRNQEQSTENDGSTLMTNFSSEVRSVETAASRLIESTIDFPNDAFKEVVEAISGLLAQQSESNETSDKSLAPPPSKQAPRSSAGQHRRVLSFSNQVGSSSTQEDQFALAKLGEAAMVNIERLLLYSPETSGWEQIIGELIKVIRSGETTSLVRVKAAEILSKLMLEAANSAVAVSEEDRGDIQVRILQSIRDAILALRQNGQHVPVAVHSTDVDIHRILLDGLKNIIENSGESLVSGWGVAFEIIGTIFMRDNLGPEERGGSVASSNSLSTRSPKLIRPSFNSLQLICSDFLSSLPNSCFLILVDMLYKFCSQDDDLNIALTTVTFYWTLSDFLSSKQDSLDITAELMQGAGESDLQKKAADRTLEGSGAALWMLLLLRLTSVTADDRLELRNSAVQSLLRIFDAYGERLSPEAWSICIKCVIFELFKSLHGELRTAQKDTEDHTDLDEWSDTSVVVLNGTSSLLANYLDILVEHPAFNHLWRELLSHLAGLLDLKILNINTATFKALSHVLSQRGDGGKVAFNQTTIDFAWDLWSRGIPTADARDGQEQDNQNGLIAYVAALTEVYKLIENDLSLQRVERILHLLCETVQEASPGGYVGDVETLTQLQKHVLAAVKMIRIDVPRVPSAVVKQLSGLINLAYGHERVTETGSKSKRTFVALSKACMQELKDLILEKQADKDLYLNGAVVEALDALHEPISLKYGFPIVTKSVQPWRSAISAVLPILAAVLPQLSRLDIKADLVRGIWSSVVNIAEGILNADCNAAAPGTNLGDDEDFDITSFHRLRQLIIPSLGAEVVAEVTRKAYAESLFKTSIIHEPTSGDKTIIFGGGDTAISSLHNPRPGRTVVVPPTTRTRMSYVALEELFSLVSCCGEGSTGKKNPGPEEPVAETTDAESTTALQRRIAATASDFLVLRCGLTLRSFAADQPLRGKMPQPLSQRREMLWILKSLIDLKCQNGAVEDVGAGVENQSNRRHLLRLYPLLVRALGVRGDEKVAEMVREALDVVGGELGSV